MAEKGYEANPDIMEHRFGHAAGDVIGIVVALGEQRQDTHFQDAFLELDLQRFRHAYYLSHDTL